MTLLEVDGLTKSFGATRAVEGVGFKLGMGEIIALIGPNGAGKSTCFNMLSGQLRPDHGSVRFEGREIAGLSPHRIGRAGVGRTFQIARSFRSFTVIESVQLALMAARGRALSIGGSARAQERSTAAALLDTLGLAALAQTPCAVLAYGDVKRTELALALAGRPRLLLMDEPTAGMDPAERADLMATVSDWVDRHGTTVLFTEHDMEVVFGHAHRVLVLAQGRLIAQGPPAAVQVDPAVREVYLGWPAPLSPDT